MARKKTKKRKTTPALVKRWRKFKPILLQRIGCLSLFVVALLVLLGLVAFRFIQISQENYHIQQEEAALYAQREAFVTSLVPEAQRLQRQYGVLASVSIGQAALESNYGQSGLAQDYHNLYGVKTEATDPAGVDLATMEYVDGEWIEIVDRFKVYDNNEASMRAHAELLYYGTSWDADYYASVIAGDDYQSQAQALQEAGYATDLTYADKVIEVIEAWELMQYDQPVE